MTSRDSENNSMPGAGFEQKSESLLQDLYAMICDVIYTYMDMRDEDIKTIALWSMVVSVKDAFETIPFIFINASKGSGKTRLLKLLEQIIPNSKLTQSLSESALFRLPAQSNLNAILIDEAERMTSKEKDNLRELLNTAYKKGGKVLRTEKTSKENFVVKEYPLYLGVALANIYGLETVLEDRCITIILEKSNDPLKTSLPELFSLDSRFLKIKELMQVYVVNVGSCVGDIYTYIFQRLLYETQTRTPTLPSLDTLSTLPSYIPTPTLPSLPTLTLFNKKLNLDLDEVYEKIINSGIKARNLELWLPIFIVAFLIDKDLGDEIIEIAKKKIEEKKEQEISEDRDVVFAIFLLNFIKANGFTGSMISIRKLKEGFESIEGKKEWLSNEWIGRFLRRTNLVIEKRRLSRGIEVKINIEKLEEFLRKRDIEIKEENLESYKLEENLSSFSNERRWF